MYFDEHGNPHVGYIANMHTQAFQGSEVILLSQLTDILIFVSLFKEQNALSEEIIDFDIICGDFNADNMSPGKILLFIVTHTRYFVLIGHHQAYKLCT